MIKSVFLASLPGTKPLSLLHDVTWSRGQAAVHHHLPPPPGENKPDAKSPENSLLRVALFSGSGEVQRHDGRASSQTGLKDQAQPSSSVAVRCPRLAQCMDPSTAFDVLVWTMTEAHLS